MLKNRHDIEIQGTVTKERCSEFLLLFFKQVLLFTTSSVFQRIILPQTTRILLFLSPRFDDNSSG